MLDYIIKQTRDYLESMPKKDRKKKGQFFTSPETARYMARMFDLKDVPKHISILDPGSGTGILAVALVEYLIGKVDTIELTCYETDPDVLPILKANLVHVKEQCGETKLEYYVVEQDYLLSQADDFEGLLTSHVNPKKYDLIIGNPPYLRVMRDNPAAMSMPTVVHGAPNLYFLFASMSVFNLKDNCEMVYIIPRSWTSGAYFAAFREYFFSTGVIEHIHLFVSRDRVFDSENVLQETIILKVRKTQKKPKTVLITSSNGNKDFEAITKMVVPYESVVCGPEHYVFMPTNQDEIDVIQQINRYTQTMPDIGIRMKTGIVVDFRQWEDLRKEPGENIVPLFYAQHIRNGLVHHTASGKEFDWITDEKPGLIQRNKDYVFCKRFTAKEERRRLQCGIYLAENHPNYEMIGTQNKINFVDRVDKKDMDKPLVYGIFVLLNSTLFDQYYRILNGSTQVNSTEINSIPVPPIEMIREMGKALIATEDLTTESCDAIMEAIAYGKN